MNSINILHDPAGACKKENHTVKDGTVLIKWLIEKYGADGFTVPTKIYKGSIHADNEIDLEDYLDCGYIISKERIFIVHNPLGIEIIIGAIVVGVIGFVVALSLPNIPVPEIPEYTNSAAGESPNNSLTGQTNVARPLQRIPDLYGQNRVYPDLIAKTYFEYINHVKFQTEYLCVGRGEFLVEQLKSGETLIDSIDGSEATIYGPNESPNILLDVTESNEVNGQEIKAPNDERLSLIGVTAAFETPDRITGASSDLYQFSNLAVGDQFTIVDADYIGNSVTGTSDLSFAAASGVNRIFHKSNLSFDGDQIIGNYDYIFSTFIVGDIIKIRNSPSNDGRYEIAAIDSEYKEIDCVEVGTSTPVIFVDEDDVNGEIDSSGSDEITRASGLGVFSVGEAVFITGSSHNNITIEIGTVTATKITCVESGTNKPVQFITELNTSAILNSGFSNDGTFTFESYVESGTTAVVTVQEQTFFNLSSLVVDLESTTASAGDTIGPFTVGGGEVPYIWADFICPQGLRTNADGELTIAITMRFQEIDEDGNAIGSPNDTSLEFTDSTPNARFYTFKIQLSTARYEVTMVRTSNTEGLVNTRDEIKWTRLAGVNVLSNPDFGNITTILIKTQATEQATAIQNRKFNAVVTRKLGTYNLDTQEIEPTLLPTVKFSDAVIHIITDQFMGNKSYTEIDFEQLYTIQRNLDSNPVYGNKLGRFCYSFSNTTTPVQSEIISAVNAARVFAYREGNTFKFVRDEKQDFRVTLFNKRNKKPDSEKKAIRFRKPNDYDGISLDWTDQETGEGSTVFFPEDLSAVNPKVIKAAGIKNYFQAWNRAKYEYLRLLYQRVTVETAVTIDGLLVSLNDRVANMDGTNIAKQSGEILRIFGDGFVDTSEVIDFKGVTTGTVILRGESGQVSNEITVEKRSDTSRGFKLLELPSFTILVRGDNENQIGTLYNFEIDVDHKVNDFIIQEVTPSSDGYVNLKMLNYSEEIYSSDNEVPT